MAALPPGGPPAGGPQGPSIPRPTVARWRTEGFAGYSVAYSPFFPGVLGVASSSNFGLVGNGRLHTFGGRAGLPEKRFDTQDGLFDLAWSEVHENQLVTSSGDGSIKLWDIMLNDLPIRNWHEHSREVFCVDWSNIRKDQFASCSWDHSIKIWTPERPASIQTINAHSACVYTSVFSPHSPDTIASCSSDGLLKVWDLNAARTSGAAQLAGATNPLAPQRAALTIPAHPTEVLCCDWNKYNPTMLATASVDRTVRIHDLRMASSDASPAAAADGGRSCIATLLGHDYAVRRVAWSPHAADVLASSGYDMSCRVWKVDGLAQQPPPPPGAGMAIPRMTDVYDAHREFVIGLAWSLFEPGALATVSWDQECHVFIPNVQ